MSGAKVAGLVVLGLVLFGVVGAANAVTTAERTALNGDYVTDRIESEGSYEPIQNETVNEVVDRIENANLSAGQKLLQAGNTTDNRTLVEDAVTESYIRGQTNENLQALYDYLHGESSELNMDINLRPLKDNLADSFASQVQEKNTSTLVEEFGPSADQTPIPVDGDLVRQMRSSPQGYEEARLDFRVDVAFEVTTTDQKLLLIGEDPRQYSEQRKEEIVDQREGEIRTELRSRLAQNPDTITIQNEQIDVREEINQRRADAKDRICDSTVQELEPDAGQQVCSELYQDSSDTTHLDNVTRAAVELQYVVVDGLARDASVYTYEQFHTDLTSSEDHLTNETGDLARSRIEGEVPDTLSAEDQFGNETANTLENAQGTVGTIDTVYLVLPIVALLLIGVAYGVTRSVETTATFTGIVLAVTGGIHLLIATVLGGVVISEVESALANADAGQFTDLATTVIEGVLSTHAVQSGILLLVGIVLIALSYASKNGQLDGLKARVADVRGGGGGGGGGQPPQQTQHRAQQSQQQPQQGQQQQGARQQQPRQGGPQQQRGRQGQQGQQQPQQGQQQPQQGGQQQQGQQQRQGRQNRGQPQQGGSPRGGRQGSQNPGGQGNRSPGSQRSGQNESGQSGGQANQEGGGQADQQGGGQPNQEGGGQVDQQGGGQQSGGENRDGRTDAADDDCGN
jgi:hypothetical protein